MAWYNFFTPKVDAEEKINPVQRYDIGHEPSREVHNHTWYYENLEIVNRGVNMVINDAAAIPTLVGHATKHAGVVSGVRRSKVDKLLTVEPNPYEDISKFKRNLVTDYILDGNIFIYFDGAHLYHIPANKMIIVKGIKKPVEYYEFNDTKFSPSEIIHIKDNSFDSVSRGLSRLKPASRSMALLKRMRDFQDNFFKNGAIPGLIIKSPHTLSTKIKDRMMESWAQKYNPSNGGRRPLILDGDMDIADLSKVSFKDLDFQASVSSYETTVLKAIGVPSILLDSGNNANIRPNLRMYYLETIIPIVTQLNFALERYFGFEVREDSTKVTALQPELRELSAYYVSLVNGGIVTPDEARKGLGYEVLGEDCDHIRVPQNIAGSATQPDEGGRPPAEEEGEE